MSASTVQPLSCPYAVAGTNVVGTGSTSANVNMTLWVDCSGSRYASANSFKDAHGFAFTDQISMVDVFGNLYTTTCSGAGICNSPHLAPLLAAKGMYVTNNGQFYYVNGTYVAGGFNTIFT